MKTSFDYIVLGLGGLGSSAAYWLSRRAGDEVLGIEQFTLGHQRGESHDHSRIIRLTYHTEAYVRFVQQAYVAWEALEADSGTQVVVRTGGLDLWPPETTLVEADYTRSMAACAVPFETLDHREIMRRFPQFVLDETVHGIHQPQGGLVGAMVANDTHRRMALRNGAVLLDTLPVRSIEQIGGGYRVRAGSRVFEGGKLVIAAGPWTNRLLAHFGVSLPLRITQEQVTYFASPDLAAFAPDRFPVWIWMIADNYYGFPVYGANGVKAARDIFAEVDPDARSFDPDPANERDVTAFMARHLPGAVGPVLYTKTCLLTHTPDADFVIDRVPGHPDVVAAVGAAHAFKFASVIGQTLSELLIDGRTDKEIDAFRFDRPALRGA